jgi:general L-amino acid transport system substrate-binding protein
MRRTLLFAVLLATCSSAALGQNSSVLQRVKARGVLRCGSVERPGLAEVDDAGRWHGLEVDVCRAIAAAALGAPDKIAYRTYSTPKEFDAVRERQDDVFFLTGSEIREQGLSERVLPGPTVFFESHVVMVPVSSPVKHVQELGGSGVCFVIGSSTERSLSGHLEAARVPWLRQPFSEEGEMMDAYRAQRCHAVAGEVTWLAAWGLDGGVNSLASRMLPERTTTFPVVAATGTEDARWASIVSWTIATLVSGERPETRWYSGGAGAMPVPGTDNGLGDSWQRRVLSAVGHYGAIYERNLGNGSPFKLPRGPNGNEVDGGLLVSPFLD